MINGSLESNLWWFERILRRELNVQEEDATRKRTVLLHNEKHKIRAWKKENNDNHTGPNREARQ
jgi:hypothetical protein